MMAAGSAFKVAGILLCSQELYAENVSGALTRQRAMGGSTGTSQAALRSWVQIMEHDRDVWIGVLDGLLQVNPYAGGDVREAH